MSPNRHISWLKSLEDSDDHRQILHTPVTDRQLYTQPAVSYTTVHFINLKSNLQYKQQQEMYKTVQMWCEWQRLQTDDNIKRHLASILFGSICSVLQSSRVSDNIKLVLNFKRRYHVLVMLCACSLSAVVTRLMNGHLHSLDKDNSSLIWVVWV